MIVALDVPALAEAAELVGQLISVVTWFKVGSELFTSAGPDAVALVRAYGGRVFLDLKYHDIPNTVARAVAAAARMGVSMLNVHIVGGDEMLKAAVDAIAGPRQRRNAGTRTRASGPRTPDPRHRPLLIGVTILTSAVGQRDATPHVVEAARQAQRCGLDGVVASAREAAAIKQACGRAFVVVTPAIRPLGSEKGRAVQADDQRRIATPADAVAAGADFLVVGRPITGADDPRRAAEDVLAEMTGAL